MGIDSTIELTVRVKCSTQQARDTINMLIGFTGAVEMCDSAEWIQLTYPLIEFRRRHVHYNIMRMLDVVDEDGCGTAVLHKENTETEVSVLERVLDLLVHEDMLPYEASIGYHRHTIVQARYCWG